MFEKDAKITLFYEYLKYFDVGKHILTSETILQYPVFSKEFILTTDVSNFALGAVLFQAPIGRDKPICYASRGPNQTEQNYSTNDKEILTINCIGN